MFPALGGNMTSLFAQLGYQPIVDRLELYPPEGIELFDAGGVGFGRARSRASAAPAIDPNQFTLFQLDDASSILDLHTAKPILEGSADTPDVRASIELLSFHLSTDEKF